MGFYQHPYLYFLLLGAVPILIHLLMRLRIRRVRWGATYVLERAIARLNEQTRWKYLLLIAVRTLVGLAIGLAFARPFLRQPSRGPLGGGETHHVLLVDNSYSMACVKDGRRAFDAGLRLLTSLTDRWARGEVYSIYTLAGGLAPVVEGARREDGRAIQRALAGIAIRDGTVRMGQALREVRRRHAAGALQVILVGDAQRANWSDLNGSAPGSEASYLWLRPDIEAVRNLTVSSLTVPGRVAVVGDALRVVARVRATRGDQPPESVVCELLVPGQGRQQRTVLVPAGQYRDVPFEVRLAEPGYRYLKVEIRNPDGLAWDNDLTASLRVRERLNLLVLRPQPARPFDNAGDYLSRALPARAGESGLAVEVRRTVAEGPLDGFDAVLLDDPETLEPAGTDALESFVRRGGGLIVGCGPNLKAESVGSRTLWSFASAAPALLPVNGAKYWTLDLSSLTDPRLSALGSAESDGLRPARFFGYWRTGAAGDLRTLARFDNGDAWLLGRAVGQGRVMVMTSGLDTAWNNLPVCGAFVHLMHRLAAVAAEGGVLPLNVARGQDIAVYLPPAASEAPVLTGPVPAAAAPVTLPLTRTQRDGLPVAATAAPLACNGLYVVRTPGAGEANEIYVSVYDDRAEGDVVPLSDAELGALTERIPWRILRDEAQLQNFLDQATGGREIYVAVIAGLAALLLLESWLSWKVVS